MFAYDEGSGIDKPVRNEAEWNKYMDTLRSDNVINGEHDILLLAAGSWSRYEMQQKAKLGLQPEVPTARLVESQVRCTHLPDPPSPRGPFETAGSLAPAGGRFVCLCVHARARHLASPPHSSLPPAVPLSSVCVTLEYHVGPGAA